MIRRLRQRRELRRFREVLADKGYVFDHENDNQEVWCRGRGSASMTVVVTVLSKSSDWHPSRGKKPSYWDALVEAEFSADYPHHVPQLAYSADELRTML